MNCPLVGAEKKCTLIIPIHCLKGLTRISAFIGVLLATTKCGLPFGESIRRLFPIAPITSANRAVSSFGATTPTTSPCSPQSGALRRSEERAQASRMHNIRRGTRSMVADEKCRPQESSRRGRVATSMTKIGRAATPMRVRVHRSSSAAAAKDIK